MEIVTPENPAAVPEQSAPAVQQAHPAENATRLQLIISVVAFVLLALSLMWGAVSGIANAKSKNTYASVGSLYQALQYYYADQGTYPSADQFQNQQVLTLDYLSAQPTPSDATGNCAGYPDFGYVRDTSQSFSLSFCLLQGVGGYPSGLSSIAGTPPAKGAQ